MRGLGALPDWPERPAQRLAALTLLDAECLAATAAQPRKLYNGQRGGGTGELSWGGAPPGSAETRQGQGDVPALRSSRCLEDKGGDTGQ